MSKNEKPVRSRPPSTRRKIGRAVIYGMLAVFFIILLIASQNLSGGGTAGQLLFVLLFLPAFLFARLSYRHFKRRHSGSFSGADLDQKDPVLFLRPFEEDAGWDGAAAFSAYRPSTWPKLLKIGSNFTALYLEMTGRLSFEQVLAHVVRKVGPLVAIGEPGSPPILGARNLYVGDDNWQQEVRDLARRSRLVV